MLSCPRAMPVAEQTRGPVLESSHPWSAVAVRAATGEVVWRTGADVVTTWRSASKPFQLAVSLAALGDPEVDEEALAVGAASHSAETVHLGIVTRLLGRFGLCAEDLRCGAHPPIHVPSAEAVLRAGGAFTDLHNNCSGKHTFMLAAAAANAWPLDYRPPDHPLQVRNRANLEALCGGTAQLAVDGCGVPTFAFPLEGFARAWAQLARAMAAPAENQRLSRIGWAMARHPELTSGTGRFDLELVRHARTPMAVKIGAQGVFCLALPERDLGLAVKVHTGVGEALAVAVPEAVEAAAPGALDLPADWSLRVVRNVVGREVGVWRPG